MSQKHTDTKKLAKGIKYLVFTLPLLFLSPYLLTLSFLNKDNLSFYDASNVPRIKEALMNGIKSIKYESNFNSSKEIKDFSKYNFLK